MNSFHLVPRVKLVTSQYSTHVVFTMNNGSVAFPFQLWINNLPWLLDLWLRRGTDTLQINTGILWSWCLYYTALMQSHSFTEFVLTCVLLQLIMSWNECAMCVYTEGLFSSVHEPRASTWPSINKKAHSVAVLKGMLEFVLSWKTN